MVKKAISWVLVGAFAFLWMWTGHHWSYLNAPDHQWGGVFDLFAVISLVVLLRSARPAGTGMFDQLVGTLRAFVPTLPWLVLALVVWLSARWLTVGLGADVLDRYVHAIVAALGAGVTTALWYGAVANAMDDG